jgi:hypothetical protein
LTIEKVSKIAATLIAVAAIDSRTINRV